MSTALRRTAFALALVVGLSGCGTAGELPTGSSFTIPATSEESRVAATAPGDASASVAPSGALPVLAEGPITPGTYVIMPPESGWAECNLGPDCPPEPPHVRSLQVEITVPAGWEAILESTVIVPASPGSPEGPGGAGLVVGWNPTGLHSDPCLPEQHETPDILVGPTVEEFVDTVVAHPSLEVTEPVDAELGGYRGRFLTLTAPSDVSDCVDWRPWEGGIAAQGPDNLWNLWVIDVDGLRVIVLASEFPGTPARDSAELLAMVDSIRFVT